MDVSLPSSGGSGIGFPRFLLRGLNHVTVEFGLAALAHNLPEVICAGKIAEFLVVFRNSEIEHKSP
ncbi:hypothetical protein KJ564_05885 [bacterium]|nr:hypothetical protein [bacterium]